MYRAKKKNFHSLSANLGNMKRKVCATFQGFRQKTPCEPLNIYGKQRLFHYILRVLLVSVYNLKLALIFTHHEVLLLRSQFFENVCKFFVGMLLNTWNRFVQKKKKFSCSRKRLTSVEYFEGLWSVGTEQSFRQCQPKVLNERKRAMPPFSAVVLYGQHDTWYVGYDIGVLIACVIHGRRKLRRLAWIS